MIDFSKLNAFASELAVTLVGDKLSTFDSLGNPSVVKEYSSTEKPPYPYISYDVRHIDSDEQWPVNSYYDNDGRLVYEFIENITFKYCCRGDKSKDIISELYTKVKIPSTRDRVINRFPGLSIQTLMPIKPSPQVVGTQFVEEHSFIIRLYLLNKVYDLYTPAMDGVEITTCLDNNESILTFNSQIPTNN